MSDFKSVFGFEDRLPPASPRQFSGGGASHRNVGGGQEARARLSRLVSRAPEVVVKINGQIHDRRLLRTHLSYISRKGELDMEDRGGAIIAGRAAVKELAEDWSAIAMADSHRRANTPWSHAMVLSMPKDIDAEIVRDASRAFARETFSKRFDYVFVLHADTKYPHVHLTVSGRGDEGERLKSRHADVWAWRQTFAKALRERGVEAEATPRWARGVTRRSERTPLRRIRELHEVGKAAPARMLRVAYHDASEAAFDGRTELTPWEVRIVERQTEVRKLYLDLADQFSRSADFTDQSLGQRLDAFVRSMPAPDSQRLALARELRAEFQRQTEAEKRRGKEEERER